MELGETPGELLRAQLKALGITVTALAARLGRSNGGYLLAVLAGKRRITIPLALDLERELGIPAQRLLYQQIDYDLARVRAQRAEMGPAGLEEEARKRKELYARPRREKVETFTPEQLAADYASGLSQTEIGVKYNTTQKVISWAMRDLGIPTRIAAKRNQIGSANHVPGAAR